MNEPIVRFKTNIGITIILRVSCIAYLKPDTWEIISTTGCGWQLAVDDPKWKMIENALYELRVGVCNWA